MALLAPLAAVRYDPQRVGGLERVTAPPYDVIDQANRDALAARSPYNVVHLVLPHGSSPHEDAARRLREWLASGVLVRDRSPALYLATDEFSLPDGSRRRRDALVGRLRLEEFAAGTILPHEHTLAGPRADRLALLRACRANLCSILGLFSRPGERVLDLVGGEPAGGPVAEVRDDLGVVHRLWRIEAPEVISRVQEAIAQEPVIIADGHHRYAAALAYRNERRARRAASPAGDEPYDYILAHLVNSEEPGTVILPTHRLLPPEYRLPPDLEERLSECFTIERFPPDPGGIDALLGGLADGGRSGRIAVARRGAELLLLRAGAAVAHCVATLPAALSGLDVSVLHAAVLERTLGVRSASCLRYTHDGREAIGAALRGEVAAAFLVNAPTVQEVREVCLAGERMPEKSTYFYPKLLTGLIFYLLDDDRGPAGGAGR